MGPQDAYVEKRLRKIITKDNKNGIKPALNGIHIEEKLTNGKKLLNGDQKVEELTINGYNGEDIITNGGKDSHAKLNGITGKDINGNIKKDKDNLCKEEDGTKLHGYNEIASGCGKKIQLEDPTKKELLVRIFRAGGGILVVELLNYDNNYLINLSVNKINKINSN